MAKDGILRIVIAGDDRDLRSKLKGSRKLLGGFAAAAAAAVAGFATFSIKKFADFDKAMTESTAIMGDVSDEMRKKMSDAAREIAKTTTFSATQAAESYYFLASAGLDAATSIEALPRVAAFAQAGAFDMARATDLLTDAQSALGLTVDDTAQSIANMTRVSDVLVRAATLANASVEQFAESLAGAAGAQLRVMNKEIEEGAAVLALLADQGLKGAAAGEALNVALRDITRAAARNRGEFAALGLEVLDSEDNLKNMADVAGAFTDVLGGMSDAQQAATLENLGLTRSVGNVIRQLMGGEDAIRDYEKALRDAGGTTGDVADRQMQTFWAQLGLLKDQFIDVALSIGERLMPHVQAFVKHMQDNMPAVEAFVDRVAVRFAELGERIRVWWAETKPSFDEFTQAIRDNWPIIQQAFADLGGAVRNVASIFGAEFKTAVDSATDDADSISGSVQSAAESFSEFASNVERGTRQASTAWMVSTALITGDLGRMRSALDRLSDGGYSRFLARTEQVAFAAGTVIRKFADEVMRQVDRVIGFFRELPGKIRTALLSPDWGGMGRAIIQGIAAGITKNVGALTSAVRKAAKKALDSAKKALGISSPSKVWEREIGDPIWQGVAKALDNGQRFVARSASQLLDQARQEASGSLQVGTAGGGLALSGGVTIGSVTIQVDGSGDPRETALAVRRELVKLGRRNDGTGL